MIIKNTNLKNLKYIKGQELPSGLVTSGLVLNLDGFYSSSLVEGRDTWKDLSGNSYDGTLLNGSTYTTDNGGGISFDGLDDTLDLGVILDNVITGINPKYTVQVWIEFDSLVDDVLYGFFNKYGLGNTRQLIISVRNLTSYSYGGIRLEHIPYSKPFLTGSLPHVRLVRSNTDIIEPNRLYNLTICFDGSINTNDGKDRPTFYINGKLQDNTLAISYNPLENSFITSGQKVSLNGYIGTGTTPIGAQFPGTIYQALMYDRVLTEQEINKNINVLNGRYNVT